MSLLNKMYINKENLDNLCALNYEHINELCFDFYKSELNNNDIDKLYRVLLKVTNTLSKLTINIDIDKMQKPSDFNSKILSGIKFMNNLNTLRIRLKDEDYKFDPSKLYYIPSSLKYFELIINEQDRCMEEYTIQDLPSNLKSLRTNLAINMKHLISVCPNTMLDELVIGHELTLKEDSIKQLVDFFKHHKGLTTFGVLTNPSEYNKECKYMFYEKLLLLMNENNKQNKITQFVTNDHYILKSAGVFINRIGVRLNTIIYFDVFNNQLNSDKLYDSEKYSLLKLCDKKYGKLNIFVYTFDLPHNYRNCMFTSINPNYHFVK